MPHANSTTSNPLVTDPLASSSVLPCSFETIFANSLRYISSLLVFCNTTNSTATFDLHTVASGGTAAAANQVFSDFAVQGDETVSIDVSLVLAKNETVQALQVTATALTLTVSGVEYTT